MSQHSYHIHKMQQVRLHIGLKNPRSLLGSAMGWPITPPLLTRGHANTYIPMKLNAQKTKYAFTPTHRKKMLIFEIATFHCTMLETETVRYGCMTCLQGLGNCEYKPQVSTRFSQNRSSNEPDAERCFDRKNCYGT